MSDIGDRLESNCERFLQEAETGDILLMSGTAGFARLIGAFTESVWSHVCMVVRDDERDVFGILESVRMADNCVDLLTRKCGVPGVRFVDAKEKLQNVDCNMCVWRKLRGVKLNFDATMAVIRECHGKPYEKNRMELVRSSFQICGRNTREATESFFCSELVAYVYMRVGVLDAKKGPSNNFTPSDFAEECIPQTVEGVRHTKGIVLVCPSKDCLSVLPFYDLTCGMFAHGGCCCWVWRLCTMAHPTAHVRVMHRDFSDDFTAADVTESLDASKFTYIT